MAAVAWRQHGVVARKQLISLGLSRHAIQGRISRGLLEAVYPGVYVLGASPLNADGRRMAAVLACGDGSAISHRSAAHLWGVFPYEQRRVEVIRLEGRTGHRGIVQHRVSLRSDEVTEVDRIPVTSVFRTIFDLAAVASKREVERAFHEAEVRQLTDRVSLPQLLTRHPGRRGARVLWEILGSRQQPAGLTQNDFEEMFVAFLDARGLPRPLLNATLPLRGRLLRPDCMWPDERLIAELDGRAAHGTDQAFEGDRYRDRALLVEGWRSTRVTWRQLRDEPEAIAADLRELLRGPHRPPTL